jgi:hypothetical protein
LETKNQRDPVVVAQDLHIHTTYSVGDSSVVPQQTVEFVARFRHARILGISDHLEYIKGKRFHRYEREVRSNGMFVGTEVNGPKWTHAACELGVDYYIYHCRDRREDYRGAEELLSTEKPVIIAHPLVMDTNLERVPPQCLIEINNRYVWRYDWRGRLMPYRERFRFVIGSDAHQPHWLNQNIARHVAMELCIEETLLFPEAVLSQA